MLSKLVRDKARNTGSVTVEEVENHYLLLKVGPGGKHVGMQNVPKNLVHRMRQRLTGLLRQTRFAWPMWNGSRTGSARLHLRGREGYRDFDSHLHNPFITTTTGYLVTAY